MSKKDKVIKKAPSAKSVIEAGIEKGKTIAGILKQISKKCPDSKADEKHVRFYANKMLREGKLEEVVAQKKYGCGARGRKKDTDTFKDKVSTNSKIKVSAKSKEKVTKKSVASKKSESGKDKKRISTRKSTSKS